VLYDALQEGIEKVQTGRHKKRAILVISDGLDAGSKRIQLPNLLNGIRGSEVLVYGLGAAPTLYADPVEHVPFVLPNRSSAARGATPITNNTRGQTGPNGVNMSVMTQFAQNSGGQAYLLADTFIDTDSSDIDRVLTSIADELRGQYTLGYYPAQSSAKLHAIRVTTRAGHKVRARTNYLAP
jgi:VWFA-related protein